MTMLSASGSQLHVHPRGGSAADTRMEADGGVWGWKLRRMFDLVNMRSVLLNGVRTFGTTSPACPDVGTGRRADGSGLCLIRTLGAGQYPAVKRRPVCSPDSASSTNATAKSSAVMKLFPFESVISASPDNRNRPVRSPGAISAEGLA